MNGGYENDISQAQWTILISQSSITRHTSVLGFSVKITEQYCQGIPNHFPFVKLNAFVIMPNHLHGIIVIYKNDDGNTNNVETQDFASLQQNHHSGNPNKFGPQSKNLASIIRGFKIGVIKCATMDGTYFEWQSRYYDRIIRDERELWNVRKCIQNNPLQWDSDDENPQTKNGS